MSRCVDQTILHDPDNGAIGNCMQAAFATLLGIPLGDVPHFAAIEGDDWREQIKNWLSARRIGVALLWPKDVPDDMPCLLAGPSPRGVSHMVVGRGLTTIHDPHPSRAGLVEIEEVWVLAPYLPDPLSSKDAR